MNLFTREKGLRPSNSKQTDSPEAHPGISPPAKNNDGPGLTVTKPAHRRCAGFAALMQQIAFDVISVPDYYDVIMTGCELLHVLGKNWRILSQRAAAEEPDGVYPVSCERMRIGSGGSKTAFHTFERAPIGADPGRKADFRPERRWFNPGSPAPACGSWNI